MVCLNMKDSLNLPEKEELDFFLSSLKICSRSDTPGWKGDVGFPLVPVVLEATVKTNGENVVYKI